MLAFQHYVGFLHDCVQVEDWFKAQGHVGADQQRLTIRQRLKNAYVELRYGLAYYDFPWEIRTFFISLLLWVVFLMGLYELMRYAFYNVENRRPIQTNFKWENDEIYDILWYAGARKNRPSEQSKENYHIILNNCIKSGLINSYWDPEEDQTLLTFYCSNCLAYLI